MNMRAWIGAVAGMAIGLTVAVTPLVAQESADDPVVLRVDGTEFHNSDLEAARAALPDQYREMPTELLYDPLIDQLINGKLLLDKAVAAKVEDDPAFLAAVATAREQIAREFYLRAEVEKATTETALQEAYDAYVAANPPQDEVRASHILVATEDEAKAVIIELSGGADFATLAKGKSTDPSAAQNAGDLGFFRKADMVPEFSDAAFAMQPGTVSGPIQTAFGWHVIRLEERRTGAAPAMAEVEEMLRGQIANEVVGGLIKSLRAYAVIERFNLDGTPRAEPVAE